MICDLPCFDTTHDAGKIGGEQSKIPTPQYLYVIRRRAIAIRSRDKGGDVSHVTARHLQVTTDMARGRWITLLPLTPAPRRSRRSACATRPPQARPIQHRRHRTQSGGPAKKFHIHLFPLLHWQSTRWTVRRLLKSLRDRRTAPDSLRCCTGQTACRGVEAGSCSLQRLSMRLKPGHMCVEGTVVYGELISND